MRQSTRDKVIMFVVVYAAAMAAFIARPDLIEFIR